MKTKDWKYFWDQMAQMENPTEQILRVSGGKAVSAEVERRIVAHLIENLELKKGDSLLDVCCGNGVLTQELAKVCDSVLGVDLSRRLVENAERDFGAKNVRYMAADVCFLSDYIPASFYESKFHKINLWFSFQYMDSFEKGQQALEEMHKLLLPGGRIFIGDVPDKSLLGHFYPTFRRRMRYRLRSFWGRSAMGKFWSESEMQKIAKSLGMELERREQPKDLPYAHYRCDYILK